MKPTTMEIKTTTSLRHQNKHQHEAKNGTNGNIPHSPPIHVPPQPPTARLKPKRLLIQSIGLIHQQLNLFSPFQNLFNILHHALFHLINLILESIDIIHGSTRVEMLHSLLDDGGEFIVETKGYSALGDFQSVFGKE
jgi:hypothetical protein